MDNKEYTYGVLGAVLAFVLWGVLAIFWKQLAHVSPLEVLANRILWSFIWMFILLLCQGKIKLLKEVAKDKKNVKYTFLAGLAVTGNWGTYIWAVTSGNVVEASLGYYINPLFLIFLGMVLYKEKLGKLQIGALLLALTGVLTLVFRYGRIPWIALLLTITFSLYGVVKKHINVEPVIGIVMETGMMLPFALTFIVLFRNVYPMQAASLDLRTVILLSCSGIVTSFPLLLFSKCTQIIEFSTMGFIQFITPTLSLLLGIFLYKEEFTIYHLISFFLIWCALALYSISLAKNRRTG